jgi:hypothetical protein
MVQPGLSLSHNPSDDVPAIVAEILLERLIVINVYDESAKLIEQK